MTEKYRALDKLRMPIVQKACQGCANDDADANVNARAAKVALRDLLYTRVRNLCDNKIHHFKPLC